jgi:hypothetical protein
MGSTGSHAPMPCHQSKGGKPRRIRMHHMDATRIQGPTRRRNRLKMLHSHGIHPRAHMSANGQRRGPLGPTRGWPNCEFGRTALRLADPSLPHSGVSLVLGCILGVLLAILRDLPCRWLLKNVSKFDPQAYGTLVAFFPLSTTQGMESVEHVQCNIQSNKAKNNFLWVGVLHLIY